MMGVGKKKQSLAFLQCVDALHRYAIAGAMCGQFALASGMAHIAVVLQVASRAAEDGRRHSVAVTYDHLVREKWASAAYNAGAAGCFDIAAAMSTVDERIYCEALRACEQGGRSIQRVGAATATAPAHGKGDSGKGTPRAQFTGACNHCGKLGHRKMDCMTWKAEQKRSGETGDEQPKKKPKRAPWPTNH